MGRENVSERPQADYDKWKGMGSETALSHDRSRTYWTPVMERYFIDLMLEQMHRGNRSGHTFNKQAWSDMLAVFNAKFGSPYDKDVLKSRYTNLWKQFNDVKNLLGHSGFSWDETRQMVIADDYVWDAYIKAHPDVRSYKTKSLLNFNDLCLIYGYTTADGRYSRSSHDIDIDDELQGDGFFNIVPPSNERPRTEWTLDMDQYFIELMLDQLGRGNKNANTFSKQAWTDMLALFNAKFGHQHGKRVLRHRYKKLWKYYKDIRTLLQQNGFLWDEEQQMIVADDEVWDAYTKTHQYARPYRMKAMPNYYDLVLIYGNEIDNGNRSHLDNNFGEGIKPSEKHVRQTLAVSDHTRTYWTPPMDRYLIDLLLEQVHRGNKLGQTFISQAWNEMVSAFNAQFRSHHDKDVLKNRYKHLRRLHNDVNVLLQQRGFSWDETREIVTADDYVWDDYAKEHHDARSYRVKTVPSYHKLCAIFGEESSEGRYSRLARNVDPSSVEVTVLMTGGRSDQFPNVNPSPIDWSLSLDRYFIDIMLERLYREDKIDDIFDEQAWSYMIDSFNKKFKLTCDKYVLEDRYMWMMKQHNDIYNLLNCSGFVWDETQEMVIAEDDVWEAYTKEHPDAITYKDKFLGHYNDLCKIFGSLLDVRFNGADVGKVNHHMLDFKIHEMSGQPASDIVGSNGERKRQIEMSSDERSCKKSMMVEEVKDAVNQQENSNHYAVEGAIDALQAIPDIDDDLMLDACDFLEDERKAKTFLALDFGLRKKWLLRKLRPQ